MLSLRRLFVGVLAVTSAGCGLADKISPAPLTIARKLEGTWTTAFPVTLYYQTDFCSGTRQNVATSQWNVTWTMTADPNYENVLNVEMRFTRSGSTPIANNVCGNSANGWVPLVSPTFLEATMSSSAITAYDKPSGISAFGSYTEDTMTLTWVHYECIIYCTGEVTVERELKLVRQR